MKRMAFTTALLTGVLTAGSFFFVLAEKDDDIARIRQSTAQFQSTPMARSAGYNLVIGFDYCFQNYGAGGMGYHYIKKSLLDTSVDVLQPEALVYAPDRNGSIELGAVEYMVPVTAWDAEHTEPPQVLGQRFHLHEKLEIYVLHVWVWKHNPSGIFEDWNPDVSCPASVPWDGPMRWR